MTYTKEDLIAFEEDIANIFNEGKIRAPVHLYYGNEDKMLEIFKSINREDWVMCTWRSHYQCLLHGVPKDKLKKAILDGKSITLAFPEHRVLSSAIVGGILPIALGVAMGIKKSGGTNKVWVFVGDMSAETGTFHECWKYAVAFGLPITFIVEDNNKSVCTPTDEVWNNFGGKYKECGKVIYYKYESKYPHAGAGKRIQF